MKLCVLATSLEGGGAEKVAVNLANEYAVKGLDVTLLTLKGYGAYESEVHESVKISSLNVKKSILSVFKIKGFLVRNEITHVLSSIRDTNIPLGISCLLYKTPRLVFMEASVLGDRECRNWIWGQLRLLLMRLSYARANSLIANSLDTKTALVKKRIVSKKNRVVVIGNPVLPDNFMNLAETPLKHPWLIVQDYDVILNVARLSEIKNQELLISAFSMVQKAWDRARLIILGSGPEQKHLESVAVEVGVRDKVDFVPFDNNPYPYYKNSDLFVLTSKSEGFGNVLVEALACGLPVLSVACPGGPRFILNEGEFGTLVPNYDEFALADKMLEIISGKVVLNKENGRRRALEFSIKNIAEIYLREIS